MSHAKNFGRDDLMVIAAFRYCLGRMTYVVGECADWIIEQWPNFSERSKIIIRRELEEAFQRDDQERERNAGSYRTLGHDCDRQQWERVRSFINAEKPE